MSGSLLVVIFLLTVTHCSKDITIVKDGEKQDTEKQIIEGKLVIEDDITKVKSDVSDVETELLDTSVFAGADVNQEQDPDKDQDEDLIVEVDEGEDKQLIVITGNETDTNIHIDIDREPGKESVDVNFEVDHDGESYRQIQDEEGNIIREEFRVDDQELNVYVDEWGGDSNDFEVINDNIDIDVYVDIDDQDLDLTDYIDFDIGLWGEKDFSANDDIFISGRYQNVKKEKKDEKIQQDPENPEALQNLIINPLCVDGLDFYNIPEYVVVKKSRKFAQVCEVPNNVQINSFEWVKTDKITGEETVVTTDKELVIEDANCNKLHSAYYKCKVTYQCDDETGHVVTRSAESEEITVMVDNGFVSNPICQIFGDPHIITFDQKIYSFQGECTYLLAMDLYKGSWFIYGKFVNCGTDGTCLEAVTLYVNGYAIELMRGWVLNQNGRKLAIKEGQKLYPDDTISLYFDGYEVYLEIHEPQIQIIWDGLMSVKIEIASRQSTLGLCGNNNDDPNDDFMTYYGNVLEDATEFGHRQAVDYRGVCVKPPAVVNFEQDDTEARAHCERVLLSGLFKFTSSYFEVQANRRGSAHELYRSDKLMDMCIFDYMSLMNIEELSAECYAGYNYASITKRLGVCLPEGWQAATCCVDKEELQDLTIRLGCPWDNDPLPFNRSRKEVKKLPRCTGD